MADLNVIARLALKEVNLILSFLYRLTRDIGSLRSPHQLVCQGPRSIYIVFEGFCVGKPLVHIRCGFFVDSTNIGLRICI